jgi:AcrR family transcriptional regulator
LQKASLYYHVASKQEILLAILDQALDLLIERLSMVQAAALPPEEKLRQGMKIYLQTLTEHQSLAAVLLLEHRSLEPEFRLQHIPRRDRFERIWKELIQEGQDSGVFSCTEPGLAARALLGVMNWTITWYRADGPLSAEEIAEGFAELFLNGLIPCDGSIE